MIQTVGGLIEQKEIGFCHSHEHLFLAKGVPATVNPALCIDDFELTIKELERFKEIGGQTIVDAQPLGSGRMEENLVRASKETGVHIIAATGFHKLIFYPENHWIFTYDVEQLTKVFSHEIEVGMYIDTDDNDPNKFMTSRAGFIKVAIDEERLQDTEKKWFIAAAEASLVTGAPIMCHIESKEQAIYITDFFMERGINPEKIILCHLDRTLDELDVHIDLAKKGAFLEYDTIGRFKYHSDEEEAELIAHIVDHGLKDNILLGLDTTRERLRSYGAPIGLDHLKTVFLPLLKDVQIKEEDIMKMMTINPGRAFSNTTLRGV